MDLDGKVAFVTGAAGGLGSNIVRACLAQGMTVAMADFDFERLQAACDVLGADQGRTFSVVLDVSDYAAWQKSVDAAEAALGPISLLANVVGIGAGSMLTEDDPYKMRKVMEVNVYGHWYGCRTLLPRMLARGTPGHIINVASMSGLISHPGNAVYDASKHAVVGMTNSLRYEISGSNVGLSLVCPGLMDTEFSANSVSYLAGCNTHSEGAGKYAEMMKCGMNTDDAGRMIVEAAVRGDYWVFTHPHWKEALDVVEAERNAAFGAPAQAGYTDGLPAASLQRHRHVMEGKPALGEAQ